MQRFLRVFWATALVAMPLVASVAIADDFAACRKQAASDYAASVRSCEQNPRGFWRLRQCKNDAKARYDRAITACNTSARKAGEGQRDWLPSPPPPPPKDPRPK